MKIVLDGSKLGLKFSACHLIVGHDRCGRLHGHNYTVTLEIEGRDTDARGLVVDFIECKDIVRGIIKKLDHRVLIAEKSREIVTTRKCGKTHQAEVELKIRDKRYVFPIADVVFLPIKSLSAEDISGYLGKALLDEFKKRGYDNIESFTVGVDEVAGQGARVRIEVVKNGRFPV